MQKVKLPKYLDPVKAATKRSEYSGVMASKDMPRWEASVASCDEFIQVDVKFAKDAQGLTYFQGELSTEAQLICQRCNSIMQQATQVAFCFTPVQGNELEHDELPDAYEPVAVNEHGEVDLVQLFEDELIITLPIVPVHAENECSVTQNDMTFGQLEPEQERENPFAVLQKLKRDQE